MARPLGGVIRQGSAGFAPQSIFGRYPPQIVPLITAKVNTGLNTSTDPNDIDPSSLTDALNLRVRYDKTLPRRGTELFGATAPDANAVLGLYNFKDQTGVGTFLRFTRNSVYKNQLSWTAITGTLTGADTNRFDIVTAFNQVVFSNAGIDPIQVINTALTSFATLGNAKRYKYITVFANRVVGAYYNEVVPAPTQIGWSGDANITQWDPNVDISAGSSSISNSPGDNTDFITGIFGFTNVIVLLRERSLWVGTKQPIATDPFSFYTDVPGIGCGCPYSAAVIPGGLCFVDNRTRKVYVYTPGSQPIDISTNIEIDLFNSISDPTTVFGSYDNVNNEYSIYIPQTGRVWIFNFRTQAWTYDQRSNLVSIGDIEGSTQDLLISQLVGNISTLTGSINSLTGLPSFNPIRVYGFNDGTIQVERSVDNTDTGTAILSRAQSKQFDIPITDQYVTSVITEFYCRQSSTITLSYSKDGGITWIIGRTDTINKLGQPVLLVFNQQIKCRKFMFKVESTIGSWDLLNYGIYVYRSGPSRATIP